MIWIFVVVLSLICLGQFFYIHGINKQIERNVEILEDIYTSGNLDRRLLAGKNKRTSEMIYKINAIVIRDKNKVTQLEKSETAYKKLVTSLSHDVRTPLATLMGYLEVLQKGTVNEEEKAAFLEITRTKATQLNDYINTLFDWMKLESGEWVYQFEEANICEETRLILAEWILRLEKEKISYQFNIPEEAVFLSLDKSVYARILNNLLANVLKHSHGNRVTVSLKYDGREAVVSVADNGEGIAETELPHIFERLYKCDRARSESSNGLGLAITKELTAALNGRITVNSEVGNGTTFFVTFPRNIKKA